ncbi:heme/copper-type cytochrome/quinol oxidase subunit 2 [Pseudarthrobacter oxydans]|nr:heme/copper-type cytochrome/quinol oxidase subunit 2 [Pseudarthrobacter oxydans]
MRLEGWHVMVFLAMLVLVAIVVVVVTFLVLWTVRLVRRRNGGGPGLPSP